MRTRTIVLCPPREVTSPNNMIEDVPNNRPRNEVHACRRRDPSRSAEEENREVDILDNGVRPPPYDEICNRGGDNSKREEIK